MSTRIRDTIGKYLEGTWSAEEKGEIENKGKDFLYESLGQLGELEEVSESDIDLLMKYPNEIEDREKWRRYLQAGKALSEKISGQLIKNLPILGEWIHIDETYGNNKVINWESIPYRCSDDVPEVVAGDFKVSFDSNRYKFKKPLEKFVEFISTQGYSYSEIADKFMEFEPEVKIPINSPDSITLEMKHLKDKSDAQMTAIEHATKRTEAKDTTGGYSNVKVDFEGGNLVMSPHSVKLRAESYTEELNEILNLLEIS